MQILKYADYCAELVDTSVSRLVQKCRMVDKMHLLFMAACAWAYVGLQMTKIFEFFFKLLLKMPDKWVGVLPTGTIKNDQGEHVIVRHASTGTKNITNKFKLFLKYYWEKDQEGGHFSYKQLHRLLNCSMLFCSYLLTDTEGNITPEKFFQSAKQFFISTKQGSTDSYVRQDTPDAEPVDVPFGDVNFNRKQTRVTSFDELYAELAEDIDIDPADEVKE